MIMSATSGLVEFLYC